MGMSSALARYFGRHPGNRHFLLGMYLVVYGLRNEGLTDYLTRLLDYFAQGGIGDLRLARAFLPRCCPPS